MFTYVTNNKLLCLFILTIWTGRMTRPTYYISVFINKLIVKSLFNTPECCYDEVLIVGIIKENLNDVKHQTLCSGTISLTCD